MRYYLLLLAIIIVPAYSQITTYEKEKMLETYVSYDSLQSLNANNILKHIGQTLFLKGNPYHKENGYSYSFYTKEILEPTDRFLYMPIEKNSKYGDNIVTDYDKVVGRYYDVLDIKTQKNVISIDYCLKLREKSEGDTIYYRVGSSGSMDDFITLGYYEKMKSLYIDKEFYTVGSYKFTTIKPETEVKPPFKTAFKCIDIVVDINEYGGAYAVLENESVGKIRGKIKTESIGDIHSLISISDYDQYINRFGIKYGDLIAQRRVQNGMTEEMVVESWGRPNDINTTTGSWGVHEQWVYDSAYVYFENGKVSAIQN